MFAATNIVLSQQAYFCHDKHMFVATKDVFCHDKSRLVVTNMCAKMILVAAPTNDIQLLHSEMVRKRTRTV